MRERGPGEIVGLKEKNKNKNQTLKGKFQYKIKKKDNKGSEERMSDPKIIYHYILPRQFDI